MFILPLKHSIIKRIMDTRALQLESRFSLPPNSLGYCGKNTAAAKFKKCIRDGICDGVGDEVRKFIVLFPYLKTISQITGKPIFSYEVIESYWIGNDLLKEAKPRHYGLLLENFKEQGVPDFFIEELKQKKPKVFIPNHLFQVLHVGVGKASVAVPFNLESINNCMIRWGKVEEINKNKAKINLNSLKTLNCHCDPERSRRRSNLKLNNQQQRSPRLLQGFRLNSDECPRTREDKKCECYKLTKLQEFVFFDKTLVPGLKIGDTVAVHWNMIIKILTKKEEKTLSSWTKEVLRSIFPS